MKSLTLKHVYMRNLFLHLFLYDSIQKGQLKSFEMRKYFYFIYRITAYRIKIAFILFLWQQYAVRFYF